MGWFSNFLIGPKPRVIYHEETIRSITTKLKVSKPKKPAKAKGLKNKIKKGKNKR